MKLYQWICYIDVIVKKPIMKTLIRNTVLATNHWPFFGSLYRRVYLRAFNELIHHLNIFPQIESIYARGGTLATVGVPGSSDIDVDVVLAETPIHSLDVLRDIQIVLRRFNERYPFIQHWAILDVRQFQMSYLLSSNVRLKEREDKRCLAMGTDLKKGLTPFKRSIPDHYWGLIKTYCELHEWLQKEESLAHMRYLVVLTSRLCSRLRQIHCRHDECSNLEALCRHIEECRFVHKDPQELMYMIWAKVLTVLDSQISAADLEEGDEQVKRRNVTLFKNETPRVTKGIIQDDLELLNRLLQDSGIVPCDVMCVFSENSVFHYDFYILMEALPEVEQLKVMLSEWYAVFNAFRALRKPDLCTFPIPVVMTTSMFQCQFENLANPIEALSFLHDSIHRGPLDTLSSFDEEEIVKRLNRLDREEFLNRVISGPPISVNLSEKLLAGYQKNNALSILGCLDFVLGVVPAKRVLLEHNIVSVSMEGAYRAYLDCYPHEPETKTYTWLYERFINACTAPEEILLTEKEIETVHRFIIKMKNSIMDKLEIEWRLLKH
jgi:hypothetical protein